MCNRMGQEEALIRSCRQCTVYINKDQSRSNMTHTRRTSIATISRTCSHFPPTVNPHAFCRVQPVSLRGLLHNPVVHQCCQGRRGVSQCGERPVEQFASVLLFCFSLFSSSGKMRELQSPHVVLALIFLCQDLLGTRSLLWFVRSAFAFLLYKLS